MWPRRYFSAVSVEIRLCCNYMASGHLHESWVLCCGIMLKKEKNMAILCCFNNDNFRSIFYGLPTDASTGISKFFTLKMCIACMTKANILVNYKEHNIPCFDNHKIKLNIFGRSIRVEVNCWRSVKGHKLLKPFQRNLYPNCCIAILQSICSEWFFLRASLTGFFFKTRQILKTGVFDGLRKKLRPHKPARDINVTGKSNSLSSFYRILCASQ